MGQQWGNNGATIGQLKPSIFNGLSYFKGNNGATMGQHYQRKKNKYILYIVFLAFTKAF